MSGHRFSEYEDSVASRNNSRPQAYMQQANLPTRISITGPSPASSMREMNYREDSPVSSINFQHQRSPQHQRRWSQQRQKEEQMIERISQLSLNSNDNNCDNEQHDDTDQVADGSQETLNRQEVASKSRSQLIDELLQTINDDSFNELVVFNNKFNAQTGGASSPSANSNRPKSAIDITRSPQASQAQQQQRARPASLTLNQQQQQQQQQQRAQGSNAPSTFDNVIRRMSTNIVQNFNKMSNSTQQQQQNSQQDNQQEALSSVRREKSSTPANSLYVDNQVPVRRHSDNTINVPRIQVALTSPQSSRSNLNQRASVSASKLANKWKLTAKTSRRKSNDKLSPNLGGALGYMRRHSSGNTAGNEQSQSNGQTSNLLFNASPFKTKSSSNLGLDFLLSNRSMKRRCSAASMLGHQTQRKAEDLIDAGMKSVQNMFS